MAAKTNKKKKKTKRHELYCKLKGIVSYNKTKHKLKHTQQRRHTQKGVDNNEWKQARYFTIRLKAAQHTMEKKTTTQKTINQLQRNQQAPDQKKHKRTKKGQKKKKKKGTEEGKRGGRGRT